MATVPVEELAATSLCSDEDVRAYLGLKPDDLTDEDRNTIVRLVNAASEQYTDESQRIWKPSPIEEGGSNYRLYRLDSFDTQVGRLRIDDCTAVTSVGVGAFRDPAMPQPMPDGSWWPWQEEPNYPISAIVFGQAAGGGLPLDIGSGISINLGSSIASGGLLLAGSVVQVDAAWGWPRVPESVRQDVIYTAAEWYARDVEKFSSTFSLDQGRILMPQTLPAQVQRSAEGWRRWRVA